MLLKLHLSCISLKYVSSCSCFVVCMVKISHKTDRFLLNYSILFCGPLSLDSVYSITKRNYKLEEFCGVGLFGVVLEPLSARLRCSSRPSTSSSLCSLIAAVASFSVSNSMNANLP